MKNIKRLNLARLLSIIYSYTPILCVVQLLVSVVHGTSWGLQVVFQQRFFDKVNQLFLGNIKILDTISSLIMFVSLIIGIQIINAVNFWLREILNQKHKGKLIFNFHKKVSKISPESFEDPIVLNDLNKARVGLDHSIWLANIILFAFFFYVPYFIFMGNYLFSLKPQLALSLLAVFIPTIISQYFNAKIYTKLEDKTAPVRRKVGHYEDCMIGRGYIKETRQLGIYHFFKKLYLDHLNLLNHLSLRAKIKANLISVVTKIIALAGYITIILMLYFSMKNNEITPGTFAAIFGSIGTMFNIMNEIICWHIAGVANNMGSIQNFIKFMNKPTLEGKTEFISEKPYIKLDGVSFRYPGTTDCVLKNINLSIEYGKTLAIVGENGSGKSTLIRIIMGLYRPSEGHVFYNNVDIHDVDINSLVSNTSAVFQKFNCYQMTLKDNITISDNQKNASILELDEVCKISGVYPNDRSYPQNYETMLSREFDGVDISGGQWQRIAIARAIHRSHNVIILDEPTSAIDPLEEVRLYDQFINISRGNTSLIITHRLGSVKKADEIIMLSNGEIIEIGSHNKLMANNGEYSNMFRAQAHWYE